MMPFVETKNGPDDTVASSSFSTLCIRCHLMIIFLVRPEIHYCECEKEEVVKMVLRITHVLAAVCFANRRVWVVFESFLAFDTCVLTFSLFSFFL